MNSPLPNDFIRNIQSVTQKVREVYTHDDVEKVKSRGGFEDVGSRELSEERLKQLIEQSKDLVDLSPQFIANTLEIDMDMVHNRAAADVGPIGFLNKYARINRERQYKRKIQKNPDILRIVSEGDSWFQFPIYVKDIIDWLNKDKSIALYSLGAGGDWIYNILHQKEYTKALEKAEKAGFFLISGGGNDLLQDSRLTQLVHPFNPEFERKPELYVKEGFGQLVSLFEFLYIHLYVDLEKRFPDLKILCHGYDYAYPTDSIGLHPVKGILRWLGGNGQWLKKPFVDELGIKNPATQHQIVKLVINRINTMHERLAGLFKNVYYVDLRGLAPEPGDWHDEIHPSSQNFKVMADRYLGKIKSLTDWEM